MAAPPLIHMGCDCTAVHRVSWQDASYPEGVVSIACVRSGVAPSLWHRQDVIALRGSMSGVRPEGIPCKCRRLTRT